MTERKSTEEIVEDILSDPGASTADLVKSALRVMIRAEMDSPGAYGMAGLPTAISGVAKIVEAEATRGAGALEEIIDFMHSKVQSHEGGDVDES